MASSLDVCIIHVLLEGSQPVLQYSVPRYLMNRVPGFILADVCNLQKLKSMVKAHKVGHDERSRWSRCLPPKSKTHAAWTA